MTDTDARRPVIKLVVPVFNEEAVLPVTAELFSEKLNALSMGQKKNRDIKRFFFSGADEFTCDKQGRVLLSAVLRQYAGITKDTVIVGVGDKAEIWSAEQWQIRDEAAEQMIEEGLDDLNLDI